MNFLFPINASVFTGEQSFLNYLGRALGGARNRNPVFSPIWGPRCVRLRDWYYLGSVC